MQSAMLWASLLLLAGALLARLTALAVDLPVWVERVLAGLGSVGAAFLSIFIESVPFLLLGSLAAGIVEVFVTREDLTGWLPGPAWLAVLVGSLAGLFIPVGGAGAVIFARSLLRKGLPLSVAVSLILAAPVLNPVTIASTVAAFGFGLILWARLLICLLIACLTGLFFWMQFERGPSDFDLSQLIQSDSATCTPAIQYVNMPIAQRLRQMLLVGVDAFFEMGQLFVMGALLAALLQTLLTVPMFLAIQPGPVLPVLALTGLAGLLSISTSVDAYTAATFTGTISSGATLAFLVYGAMVNIPRVWMLTRMVKPRAIVWLVALPLLFTLIFCLLLNSLWGG